MRLTFLSMPCVIELFLWPLQWTSINIMLHQLEIELCWCLCIVLALMLLLGALDVLYMLFVRLRYLYSCHSHLFILFKSRWESNLCSFSSFIWLSGIFVTRTTKQSCRLFERSWYNCYFMKENCCIRIYFRTIRHQKQMLVSVKRFSMVRSGSFSEQIM